MIRRILIHAAIGTTLGVGAVAIAGLVCAALESDALKRVRHPQQVKPWLRGLR